MNLEIHQLSDLEILHEVELRDLGRESRWCLFHWSTVKTDPEIMYCRIAEWSGINENPWCRLTTARIVPVAWTDPPAEEEA